MTQNEEEKLVRNELNESERENEKEKEGEGEVGVVGNGESGNEQQVGKEGNEEQQEKRGSSEGNAEGESNREDEQMQQQQQQQQQQPNNLPSQNDDNDNESINDEDDDGDTEGELDPSIKKEPIRRSVSPNLSNGGGTNNGDSTVTTTNGNSATNLTKRQKYLLQFTPKSTTPYQGTLQAIFQRCIASILASRGISTSAPAFEFISLLAEEYMSDLFSKLFKTCQIQRRHEASVADLRLTMDHFNIRITDLEKELKLKSRYTDILNQLKIDPEQEPLGNDQVSFFNSQISNLKYLVPSNKQRGDHIPSWMPPLPPDHTFMSTPQYSRNITEPRELREKLVEEGRLAEAALRRLVGMEINDDSDGDGDNVIKVNEGDVEKELQEFDLKSESKERSESDSDSEGDFEDLDLDEIENTNTIVTAGKDTDGDIEMKGVKVEQDESKIDLIDNDPTNHRNDLANHQSTSPQLTDTNGKSDHTIIKSVRFADETQPQEEKSITPPTANPKPFSLKISFGSKKSKLSATPTPTTTSTTTTPLPTTIPSHPSDFISQNKSSDILAYVNERIKIIERRKQIANNTEKRRRLSEDFTTTSESSNTTIEQEFKKVLSSVSKRNKKNPNSISDQELVIWDRNRYI